MTLSSNTALLTQIQRINKTADGLLRHGLGAKFDCNSVNGGALVARLGGIDSKSYPETVEQIASVCAIFFDNDEAWYKKDSTRIILTCNCFVPVYSGKVATRCEVLPQSNPSLASEYLASLSRVCLLIDGGWERIQFNSAGQLVLMLCKYFIVDTSTRNDVIVRLNAIYNPPVEEEQPVELRESEQVGQLRQLLIEIFDTESYFEWRREAAEILKRYKGRVDESLIKSSISSRLFDVGGIL